MYIRRPISFPEWKDPDYSEKDFDQGQKIAAQTIERFITTTEGTMLIGIFLCCFASRIPLHRRKITILAAAFLSYTIAYLTAKHLTTSWMRNSAC